MKIKTPIQMNRGLRNDKPLLKNGEIYVCEDTNDIFIGNTGGEKRFEESLGLEPAIVITYDDASSSIYEYAWPVHKTEGVPGTFYVISSYVENPNSDKTYGEPCTWAQIQEMYNDTSNGRIEIQNHTHTHLGVGAPTGRTTVSNDIKTSIEMFESKGIETTHLSYPGGKVDLWGKEIAQKYFSSARGADEVYNYRNQFDPWNIRSIGRDAATDAEINANIDHAKATGAIAFLYFHAINPTGIAGSTGKACLTPTRLQAFIQYAKSQGVRVISHTQALHELQSTGKNKYNLNGFY